MEKAKWEAMTEDEKNTYVDAEYDSGEAMDDADADAYDAMMGDE